ncbi:MAG: hypothetical protein AAF598_04535 [Bacteroidota bacterium]
MIKLNHYSLKKLERLFEALEYKVIYEKGTFNSGYCIVESKNMIVINKFYDTEARVNTMLDILSGITIDESKLEPNLLQFLKKARKNWQEIETPAPEETENPPS